jgi:hypothetical protein
MDPGEPADLPSCEVQLRGMLERVRAALRDEIHPVTITRTLEVMPDLLKLLNLLRRIVQAHLDQLAGNPESKLVRDLLVELRKRIGHVLQLRTNVHAAANLAEEARIRRSAEVRIQTPTELQEERTVAGPWEDELLEGLQDTIDDLHKINQQLPLGPVDLPRPDQGGGALAGNQPYFDSRRHCAPGLVT